MLQEDIAITNRNFKDFNPIVCGHHVCDGGYFYGPNMRNCFLVHYVESGKGVFVKRGKEYPVHKNQIFVIVPGEVTKYIADKDDPWVYSWIGFTGEMAEKFRTLPPVADITTSVFSRMLKASDYKSCREEFLCHCLWEFYCELFENSTPSYDCVKTACDYINAHYTGELHISDVARAVGLERTYLSKIFRQKTGITMQNYLIDARLNHAKELLLQGYNVSQAAIMCGYDDQFNFSKMFKKKFGKSPSAIS